MGESACLINKNSSESVVTSQLRVHCQEYDYIAINYVFRSDMGISKFDINHIPQIFMTDSLVNSSLIYEDSRF
jgi:hypothetical protein